jgi:RNA polymerase sigma factor (sigma-70 family)
VVSSDTVAVAVLEEQMYGSNEKLRQQVDAAIHALSGEHNAACRETIGAIVVDNLDSGRLVRFLENGTVGSVAEYVQRVVTHYGRWSDYLARLEQQDDETWDELYEQLQAWARGLLRRVTFSTWAERNQHAVDCATDAALVLTRQTFPFDVNFEAWTYVVLRNVTLRHIDNWINPTSVPAERQIAFANYDDWLQNTPDPTADEARRRFEWRQVLNPPLKRLSDAQQELIQLYYFESKSYAEIASFTGKTRNALYKSHFDALQKLRAIFEERSDLPG